MGLADYVLYRLAKNWPSPMARLTKKFDAEPGTEAYNMAYAQNQFNQRVGDGLMHPVTDLDVLEIGAGHGGISCFMAAAGARRVVGIDLSAQALEFGRRFVERFSTRYAPGYRLPVEFLVMNAAQMGLADASFDLVLADNVFEHFTDPEAVMRESYRVLRPRGVLLVPSFSSIKSKYGLHLKHGLKLPWANLLFSERTIVRAMQRLAVDDPRLLELYPGLNNSPQRVRDLRRHGDLNDITYRRFKAMAARLGFKLEWFSPHGTGAGRVLAHLPILRRTIVADVMSTGAAALLRKTE